MQNSDLKNVLIAAVQNADTKLLSMLYAVTKSYQAEAATTVTRTTVPTPAPAVTRVVQSQSTKDDRPRKVLRVYRKPQDTVAGRINKSTRTVASSTTAAAVPAPRVIRVAAESRTTTQPTVIRTSSTTRVAGSSADGNAVSGISNNGGFISTLMTKTVSKDRLPM